MKKIVICFPGVGYHCDKPLLYFGRKIVQEAGYETCIRLSYIYQGENIRGNQKKMQEAFDCLYAQAEQALQEIAFEAYDRIVFLSKSIGTVIACAYAKRHGIPCRQILYTPLEETFAFAPEDAVAFIGANDPWSRLEKVEDLAKKAKIPLYLYEGADHSLECGRVEKDLNTLQDVMEKTRSYLQGSKAGIVACSDPQPQSFQARMPELCEALKEMHRDPILSSVLYEPEDGMLVSAKEKAAALMKMYEDPAITDIFDISGGNMANEILPELDFGKIKKAKATFWGYSDLTTIVNAITAVTGKESVLYQLRNVLYAQKEIQRARLGAYLKGENKELLEFSYSFLQGREMEGEIVGGNIRCFLKLAGTEYMPDLNGKILLLEAYGGSVPQMVTYLAQLKMIGAFEKINGILLGTFTQMQQEQVALDMAELVRRVVGDEMPIAKTEEVGHGTDAKAVVIGRHYVFKKR